MRNFLWNTTKMNTRVIVSREDIEPLDVAHAGCSSRSRRRPRSRARAGSAQDPGHHQDLRAHRQCDTDRHGRRAPSAVGQAKTRAVRRYGKAGSCRRASRAAICRSAVERAQDEVEEPTSPQPARTDQPAKSEIAAAVAAPAKPRRSRRRARRTSEPSESNPKSPRRSIRSPPIFPEPILASFEQSLDAKPKKAAPTGPCHGLHQQKDKRLYVRQALHPAVQRAGDDQGRQAARSAPMSSPPRARTETARRCAGPR